LVISWDFGAGRVADNACQYKDGALKKKQD
jgi:hypothetical protein